MADFVAQVVALAGEKLAADPKALAAFEHELRFRYAGERFRIAFDAKPVVTIERVEARLRERVSIRQIATEIGVSRETIYRVLRGRRSTTKA